MSLRGQNFQASFDTSHDEIAAQFYIPALKSSIRYERAVGYFTSGWFRVNAAGMAEFASQGGQARWIVSPVLDPEDKKALEQGYEAAAERVLTESIRRGVAELERALTEETRSAIAWLIADRVLDFRIAIPCGKLHGDFHVKFGIFYDADGNVVAFDGSQNETERGFENYESIKIFWSWDPALAVYVESDIHRFERLWNDRDPNVRIHTVPEAIRQDLLRLRTLERPYTLPGDSGSRISGLPGSLAPRRPWPHQERAVLEWEKARRRGILVMATGSGKTQAALMALSRTPLLRLVLIAVPHRELVSQWSDALIETLPAVRPLRIMEASHDWLEPAYRQLVLAQSSGPSPTPIVLVGTYQSVSSRRFQGLLGRLGLPSEGALLIADEVHNAGAPTFQRTLHPDFQFRIGLTATLERAFDPEGTRVLLDYFSGVVFEFGIDRAIEAGVLCPYRYEPLFATLSDFELHEYEELTERIARRTALASAPDDAPPVNPEHARELEELYFRRARILKKCKEKISVLAELLERVLVTRGLVYCADFEQVDEVEGVLRACGIPWLRFSSQESRDTRERALTLLAQGHIRALVSINCLDEGVDIPDVREGILVASSGNPRQFVQRRGRLLRRVPGKREALLYDILATPPAHVRYRLSPMLSAELRRATLLARSARNADAALAKLLTALEVFGLGAADLLL